jgi:hypothetical protein
MNNNKINRYERNFLFIYLKIKVNGIEKMMISKYGMKRIIQNHKNISPPFLI